MNEVRDLLPVDILETVLDTYEIAIRYAFVSTVAMALLSLIASVFIQRYELQTKVRK